MSAPEFPHVTVEELAEDYLFRLRQGEQPDLHEYTLRHPHLAGEIRDVFPVLLLLEEAGPGDSWSETDPRMDPTTVSRDGIPLVRLDDYRILRLIGQGGMGVVYEADQESLGRRVALKVLPLRAASDPKCLVRFRREARSAAQLHHTNIVPVFDVGYCSGVHYYAMQFICGESLDDVIFHLQESQSTGNRDIVSHLPDEFQHPATAPYYRAIARLGLQVALALGYAHGQKILHRDIKPGNLLLDSFGVVWVTDFGLAKEEGGDLTTKGDIVGTLRYMAPERFEGKSTPGSDIYSLGITLYELLTLKPAFADSDRARFVRDLAQKNPYPLRRADPHIPRDLETIIWTAIAKDPHRRYATSEDLGEDLRRFLNNMPIRARRTRWHERAWRTCLRNPLPASLLAALIISLVLGIVGVTSKWHEAEFARDRERVARIEQRAALQLSEARAAEVRDGFERLKLASALVDQGRAHIADNRWDDARHAFSDAILLRPDHFLIWAERGELYAKLGLWELAADDFIHEAELHSPDIAFRSYLHALLCLSVNDATGYMAACRRMHARFNGTTDGRAAEELARSQLLLANNPETNLTEIIDTLKQLSHHRPHSAQYILGLAHFRAGHDEEAIAQLNIALNDAQPWPITTLSHSILAMALYRQGHLAEAHQSLDRMRQILNRWTDARCTQPRLDWIIDYRASDQWVVPWWDYLESQLHFREAQLLIEGKLPQPDPRQHLLRARAFAALRWSEKSLEEYERARTLLPDDATIHLEFLRSRGGFFVDCHEWRDAATQFAQAVELRPTDSYLWRFLAVTQFAASDLSGYRQTCAAMLHRFEHTKDGIEAGNVLLACTICDKSLPDPTSMLRFIDVADHVWHWGAWARGAVLYRAGRAEESLHAFESAASIYRPNAWDWSFQAMAHAQLGHSHEAKHCLAQATAWLAEANHGSQMVSHQGQAAWGAWHEPVVYPMLVQEAQSLIDSLPANQE